MIEKEDIKRQQKLNCAQPISFDSSVQLLDKILLHAAADGTETLEPFPFTPKESFLRKIINRL